MKTWNIVAVVFVVLSILLGVATCVERYATQHVRSTGDHTMKDGVAHRSNDETTTHLTIVSLLLDSTNVLIGIGILLLIIVFYLKFIHYRT